MRLVSTALLGLLLTATLPPKGGSCPGALLIKNGKCVAAPSPLKGLPGWPEW